MSLRMSRNTENSLGSRYCPLRPAGRMTRCECHEMEFDDVAAYAREHGIYELGEVSALLGCCQTCTACQCDLKERLRHEESQTHRRIAVAAAVALSPRRRVA